MSNILWIYPVIPGINPADLTPPMRVLLHDIDSDRYFHSPEAWTADPGLALNLEGTVQAVNVAFQQRLRTAEIILAFDEAHLANMHLPLSCPGTGF